MIEDLEQKQTISDFSRFKLLQEIRFLEEGELNSGFEQGSSAYKWSKVHYDLAYGGGLSHQHKELRIDFPFADGTFNHFSIKSFHF